MNYKSTRNSSLRYTASKAILTGISPDGGLFLPEETPVFAAGELSALVGKSYKEVAKAVISKYLTDFTDDEIVSCIEGAYTAEKFGDEEPVCLSSLVGTGLYSLELWHGPTCAFKDMALQILPRFMNFANAKNGDGSTIRILVATSGDTGKAALEGFKDAPGTAISVFYPQYGVSNMQKRQMITQEGQNVQVVGIEGNFDDAQTGVKTIFTSEEARAAVAAKGEIFSSANSINWGRLLPQIVYYVYSYTELAAEGELKEGDAFNVVVPTGNFGNILAAYYAKLMGVPVGKLICASNDNCVLTDFFATGTYNKNRPFYATTSPSMDILVSSNLERLLYLFSGENDEEVRQWYDQMAKTGTFTVSEEVKQLMDTHFYAAFADEEQVADTIAQLFDNYGYLCDTHTAVGFYAALEYKEETGDNTPIVVASTASPYKFADSVIEALGETPAEDDFERLEQLYAISGFEIPEKLASLQDKEVRFTDVCTPDKMLEAVLNNK